VFDVPFFASNEINCEPNSGVLNMGAGFILKFSVTLLLVTFVTSAWSQSGSLQECQVLKDRIDRYTDLRRGGGTASKMDAWKRSRTRAEEEFRELDCHWYGSRLK